MCEARALLGGSKHIVLQYAWGQICAVEPEHKCGLSDSRRWRRCDSADTRGMLASSRLPRGRKVGAQGDASLCYYAANSLTQSKLLIDRL